MAKTRRKKQGWSYSAGEWGQNRVRAFENGGKGIYLEFWEEAPERAAGRRRVRVALGHADRTLAKAKADEAAAALRRQEAPRPAALTLARLFDSYEREVSPGKAPSTRRRDARTLEMYLRFLGRDWKPQTLSRVEWDRFIAARRRGEIAPAGVKEARSVGNRVIEADLRLLLAVLNWATVAGDGKGGVLLERNPLKGLVVPREESPKRPTITDEQYVALRRAAAEMGPFVELFLVISHETGHRAASIRQLRWSDVDLERATVTWRPENDKIGYGHTTPLTDEAVAILKRERARAKAIGDAWVFPARRGRQGQCLSGDAARHVWRRLADRAGLPASQRYGWHSLRRKFANELRDTNLKDLSALGGWRSPATILAVYLKPDEATQRAALAQRRKLGGGGVS